MYRCESWTIKDGWVPKNWCFETVVLEKTLESPFDGKEIKPVNPKEISSEYSLEWLRLKWKLQYFDHLMGRANSLEKTLMLGKIEGKRRRERQRMRWLDGITDSMGHEFEQASGRDGEWQGSLMCCSPWGRKQSDTTERLNNNNIEIQFAHHTIHLLCNVFLFVCV